MPLTDISFIYGFCLGDEEDLRRALTQKELVEVYAEESAIQEQQQVNFPHYLAAHKICTKYENETLQGESITAVVDDENSHVFIGLTVDRRTEILYNALQMVPCVTTYTKKWMDKFQKTYSPAFDNYQAHLFVYVNNNR